MFLLALVPLPELGWAGGGGAGHTSLPRGSFLSEASFFVRQPQSHTVLCVGWGRGLALMNKMTSGFLLGKEK